MSSILAVLDRRGAPVDVGLVERLLASVQGRARDGRAIRCLGPVALAIQPPHSRADDEADRQPLLSIDASQAIVFDGRLDDRGDLRAALGATVAVSDAHLVLAAYHAWGPSCVERLRGDFAFALWDSRAGEMLVARDALGTRGLSYFMSDRLFLAATDVETILAHPDVPGDLDEVRVALYLASDWRDQERTFFEAVRHVEPAGAMSVGQTSSRSWRHWELDPGRRHPGTDHRELAMELRDLLATCTADRLRLRGPVGVSLSGGLDSATVAAHASRELANCSGATRLRSYSFVFDDLTACDERRWIEPIVRMHDLDATYLPCDDCWTLRDPPRWPTQRGFVDADAFGLLPSAVRDAAQHDGVRLLLTGHFGDVLFLAGRYWLAEMLYEGRLADAATALWQARRHVRWRTDLWELGLRSLVPSSLKTRYRHARPRPLTERAPAVSRTLARRTGLEERLVATSALERWPRPGDTARYLDLALGPRPHGLAASRPTYERMGMELADPFHDRRVVELVAGLPAEHLGLPGNTKRLLRSAMVGLLPEPVRTRGGKTDFAPLFRRGLLERERWWVEQLAEHSVIVERGYVGADWLRTEIARGSAWTDGGFWLWLCIGLELWLRRLDAGGSRPGHQTG